MGPGTLRGKQTMKKIIKPDSLLLTCEEALTDAISRYNKWSGKLAKRRPPESFVQYVVVEKIAEEYEASVLMEEKVSDIIAGSKAPPPRNKTGRVDIVIYSKDEFPVPIYLIEIKIIKETKSFDEDKKRVEEIMKQCPSIKCGVLVGYSYARNSDKDKPDSIRDFDSIANVPVTARRGEFVLSGGACLIHRT